MTVPATITAAVVGSLNADLITTLDRIPLVGETRQAHGMRRGAGGKGANQAVALARLGAHVRMAGHVGDDADGRALVAGLTGAGVSCAHVAVVPDVPTGLALVMVDGDGDNAIVVVPGANAQGAVDPAVADGAGLLLVQLEIPDAVVRTALHRGAAAGALTVLNAAPARQLPDDLLALVDVLVVNESEARELGGRGDPADCAAALHRRGPRSVVVTLGPAGSLLHDDTGTVTAAGVAVTAVDTTGAGDCFVAALGLALAEGRPAARALRFANTAAALAVTRPGAQDAMPTRAEVEAWAPPVPA